LRSRPEDPFEGIRKAAPSAEESSTREIASAYADRLSEAAKAWTGPLPDRNADWSHLHFFRFFDEVRRSWPVEGQIYSVAHPGGQDGQDSILNPVDEHWLALKSEPGKLYWEFVEGNARFKIRCGMARSGDRKRFALGRTAMTAVEIEFDVPGAGPRAHPSSGTARP
jgi:hypothetical protein